MTIPGVYTQRDPRWSSQELGYNNDPNYNLYHYGCLVTGISNLLWYTTGNGGMTPEWVNNWLKERNGFEAGGGNVVWGVANQLLESNNIHAAGFSSDLGTVNNFLQADNNFALVWMSFNGFPQHWSVAPFVNQIADSWDGVVKNIPGFRGAHLYSYQAPQGAVVVPPQPPIEVPTPEPIPSVDEPQAAPIVEIKEQEGSVLANLPEYEATYHEERSDTYTQQPFAAIDMTGKENPIPVPSGTLISIAGKFTVDGQEYARTTKSVEDGKWWGLNMQAFTPAEPSPVSVPVVDETKPVNNPLLAFFKLLALIISKFNIRKNK